MTGPFNTDDQADSGGDPEARDHARHRKLLSDLMKLTEIMEAFYFGNENVLEGLPDTLRRMVGEMEAYLTSDELTMFASPQKGGMA